MKIKWIVSYRGELGFEVIGRDSPYNRLRVRVAPPLMGNYSEPIGLLHLDYSTLPMPDDIYHLFMETEGKDLLAHPEYYPHLVETSIKKGHFNLQTHVWELD